MASRACGPVEKRFALGSENGFLTPVLSIVTAVHSVLAIVSIFGLACHDAPGGEPVDCSGRSVRMGVASSLREVARPLREELLARDEPIDVEMIFGASSTHARQLALGAPMRAEDILVSLDRPSRIRPRSL